MTVPSAPGPFTLVPPPASALVPHRLAAALPARYCGLRLCCARLAAVRPSRPSRPARLWLYRPRPARAPSCRRPRLRLSCTGLPRPCPRDTVASVCAALSLPPSGPRVLRALASVTAPSAPGPRTLVPPPAPALVPHRLAAALPMWSAHSCAGFSGRRPCPLSLRLRRPVPVRSVLPPKLRPISIPQEPAAAACLRPCTTGGRRTGACVRSRCVPRSQQHPL